MKEIFICIPVECRLSTFKLMFMSNCSKRPHIQYKILQLIAIYMNDCYATIFSIVVTEIQISL
jgi:hypothetical protein